MSKFKVGDRVRNIDSNSPNYRKIGVITSVSLFNYVKYDNGNLGQGDDCYYELYEETPKKIAAQCDTIEEWRAVLDKLFSEGKRWITSKEKEYHNDWFYIYDKICLCISDDEISYARYEYLKEMGYSIIPAKEYLGKDVNEKKTPLIIASTPRMSSSLWEKYQELQNSIEEHLEQNKKPNKIKQMTNELKNNIVDFAKNLTLSLDEKVLREVGLKDENSNWTENAMHIVLDLEAVSLGCEDFNKLGDKYLQGDCETSTIEVAMLIKKYEAQLLEIAKKMKEENNGGKKK